MNLLIVDDHDTNLRLLRAQLEAEGHTVVDAANGVEALDALATQAFDGVISDILMPRMDGYRLCLEVRKDPRFANLPFVLYTSTYNSSADRDLARSAGADAYIEKPAPTRVILDALASATLRPRAERDGFSHPDLESPVLKQYSETLVRKLETKSLELQRVNEGLVQVEARLSGLVDSAMDGIIAIDSKQTVVLFNVAAGRMFGCTCADAMGKPLSTFIPLRYHELHDAHVAAFANGPATEQRMGTRIVSALRTDGTEFPIEASISKLFTSQGMVYTVFVRDVTERRLAEQAMAQNEAVLRRAQALAQLAHVITRVDSTFESWSETLPLLIGMTAATVPRSMGEWLQFVHPEDRTAFRHGLAKASAIGRRAELNYRVRNRDDWIDVRHVLEPLPDHAGQQGSRHRWFNTLQNITEQKKSETRIRSLNRVHAMFSGITSMIVRTHDRTELLRGCCRIAVDAGHFCRAWVALVEPRTSTVRVESGGDMNDDFLSALSAHLAEPGSLEGRLFGPVLTDSQPVFFNALHPGMPPGTRSVAGLPLVVDGKTVGALFLHAESPDFFDAEEAQLLSDLAGDMSFALDHIHKSDQLVYLANFDALTGLPNRGLFVERLSRLLVAPGPRETLLAVVLLDLERFRRVNETLGRTLGDRLLVMVAERLSDHNDSVARVGVDLFAITVTDRATVTDVARAIEELTARCFGAGFELSGQDLRVGCRSGIAVFPTDGEDADTLLHNAEAALRQAKQTGASAMFYAPAMNATASQSLAFESRLRRAIERQEFVLHYQPKLALPHRRITGVEALLRWQDPEGGLVMPGEFIPVLEEAGLIGIVGDWALQQALSDHRRWRDAGLGSIRVAVNVSSLQLQNRHFVDSIEEAVRLDGGDALELEITESVIMDNFERNIALLDIVRALGVRVAIDDFGTGYSSLAYIARLPVTSLKIDRSFVSGVGESPEGLAIASSIIALAHALRLKVVAEGVETVEQARLLALLNCDEAQGYLYSRPVPARDIDVLLANGWPPPA